MNAFAIATKEVKGRQVTMIQIGEAAGELPRHLMVGERECGWIVRNGQLEQWYYDNLSERDGQRVMVFKALPILPFESLFGKLRGSALHLLRELAEALQAVPKGFVNPTNGWIETWRIWFLERGGVLLLPASLSNIISATVDDAVRFDGFGLWVKPQVEGPFALCHQFTQFLYAAATGGVAPYQRSQVREDSWRPVPLALGLADDVDPKVCSWIDKTLAMPQKDQRELFSAAYSGEENLSWFLEQTEAFAWNAGVRESDDAEFTQAGERVPAVRSFLAGQEQRAKRRVFWRKKGVLVSSLVAAGILVIALVGNMVVNALQPPYTKDMEPAQIITEFFSSQNALNVEAMGAALARGVKNPLEMEVSGLFVNSKVRMAYEGKETVIRADQWVAEGMPALPESSMVYGVADLEVLALGDDRYRATYRYFGPVYDESDGSIDGGAGAGGAGAGDAVDASSSANPLADGAAAVSSVVKIAESLVVMEFSFTNVKGYWQISAITPVSAQEVAIWTVPAIASDAGAGSGAQFLP